MTCIFYTAIRETLTKYRFFTMTEKNIVYQGLSYQDGVGRHIYFGSYHRWTTEPGNLARFAMFITTRMQSLIFEHQGIYLAEFRHAAHTRSIVATIL